MLKLLYYPTNAGAPDDYGDSVDRLLDGADKEIQTFRKATDSFIPPEKALIDTVEAWLKARPHSATPPVVMVHGYMFDPRDQNDTGPDSPFGSVYGETPPIVHNMSWLPLVGADPVAFSYKSIAGFFEYGRAGWTNSYQHAVFDLASQAARALATVLAVLGTRVPSYRILAHSLGTRTTSLALRLLLGAGHKAPERVVLLDGAEFSVDACVTFKNCQFDVFNIVNGTDTVLQIGATQACHPLRETNRLPSCVVGLHGLGTNPRWMDLQLDSAALSAWLAGGNAPTKRTYAIDPDAQENSHSAAWLRHWSCYTNDGNREFVSDLLLDDRMTVAALKNLDIPSGSDSPSTMLFDNVPIPRTPTSRSERSAMMAQTNSTSNT